MSIRLYAGWGAIALIAAFDVWLIIKHHAPAASILQGLLAAAVAGRAADRAYRGRRRRKGQR